MALKKRFQKKSVEKMSVAVRDEQIALAKEKIGEEAKQKAFKHNVISGGFSVGLDPNNMVTHKDDLLERKLACYHKINELYQNSSLSLFNLMGGILEIVCHGVEAEGGSIWILGEDEKTLSCKVATGPGSDKLVGFSVEKGNGIVGWVGKHKRSTIVYDANKDERFIGKKNKDFNTRSLIASPLLYDDEVIGVLEVINKTSKVEPLYNDSDKAFVDDLATLSAMHIKTSRLVKKQSEVLRRMNSFSELHEKFSSTIDLDQLLDIVLKKAISFLRAEVGSIWLVEDNGEGVYCAYAEGPTKDKVLGVKLKMGTGIIGSVIQKKESQIVVDCSQDDRFSSAVDKKTNFKTKSILSVPLTVKGECIGAIQIINKKGKDALFNQDDLELLTLFGSSSAMYIKNARLFTSEKKAKDLSALIGISKEITSSLDLDSILTSIVNLSSNLIPFDEAAVSVNGMKEVLEVRAISGQYEVDREDDKTNELELIHREIAQVEEAFIEVNSIDDCPEGIKGLKNYMEKNEINSFFANIFRDDQGVVGVYSIESEEINFMNDSRKELLTILAGQATVSLRNAELYNTIPNAQVIKNFQEKIIKTIINFKNQSRTFYFKILGGAIAFLAIMFVPVPHSVGTKIEVLPVNVVYNSQVNGVVSKVHVQEGDFIKKGQLLAEIDVESSKLELVTKGHQLIKTRTEMLRLKHEESIADFKIKEAEYLSLKAEVDLLNLKIAKSKILSDIDGVVISENLDELVGMPINFGQEIIRVSHRDELIIQLNINEEDVKFVEKQQDVIFKVYGIPTASFSGIKINSIAGEGRQVLESDPNIYYLAKSKIDASKFEQAKLLKPGMTGRGKIETNWISLGKKFFRKIYQVIIMDFLF